jgi:hypothetical protein
MGRDVGRRELLPTVVRASGLFTGRTQLVDWGADVVVQARVARLLASEGATRA